MGKMNIAEIKEKLIKLAGQFDKDAILYAVLLLGIIIFGLTKFVLPNFFSMIDTIRVVSEKKEEAKSMQDRLSLRQQKVVVKKAELPIKIYETPYKGLDLENAAVDLVNQVIAIIKADGRSTITSIDFAPKELIDSSGMSSKEHEVLNVKIQLDSSYESVQYILNQIYLMDYLIKIQNVTIEGEEESNFETVKANIDLDLLVKTS